MGKSTARLLRLQRLAVGTDWDDTEIRHEHVIQQTAEGCRHALYTGTVMKYTTRGAQ